jgi:hypothetical protein
MQSLYAKFANLVESMSPKQRDQFYQASGRRSMTIETKVQIAERVLSGKKLNESQTEQIRENARIVRNNGSQVFTEADRKVQAVEEADTKLFKALGIPVKDKLPKVIQEAGPQVVADYEFCRRLPMSEADAVKCATENLLRDSSRAVSRRRELIKD